ncbi:MAG: hypothetical protein M3P48_10160 [Actinomycetota bacterium]|nr:hypothetical protein [Actinomycetota bacterium]
MAFVVVGVIGAALLVLSLVLGGLLDGFLDGALHALDVLDTGWLSTESIGGFLAAFGLVGWAVEQSAGTPVATAAGGLAGVLVGAFARWAARTLDATPTDAAGAAATWSAWKGSCSPRSVPRGTARSPCGWVATASS